MNHFLKRAKELEEAMRGDRRYLHEHAEAGMALPGTVDYVMKRLRELGLEPEEAGGGVTAVIPGNGSKTLLLRADMDALPMEEHNDLPFRSKTKDAHTCGHDMHTAMLLAAAAMLCEQRGQLKGNVKLMFQPGEECFTGSKAMIDAGLLENPHVDAALGMHVMLDAGPGTVCFGEGDMTSSCDGFRITIKGKGCHGAMPHMGVDPINVGAHLYFAFQELIARETPPAEAAILTFGQFTAGNTPNIIPETAVLQGTLRTYNKELRQRLAARLREVAEFTAKAFGAAIEYETLSAVPSTYTDPGMLRELLGYIDKMDGAIGKIPGYRVTPSDDFAFVAERVPTVYLMLCAKTEGNPYQHHNPGVLFNEEAMPLGAAIYAQCAKGWLDTHGAE